MGFYSIVRDPPSPPDCQSVANAEGRRATDSTTGLTMLWATMFLVGGLVSSTYKWGYYVFGLFIYFFLLWQVLGVSRRYASKLDTGVHNAFSGLAAYTLFLM